MEVKARDEDDGLIDHLADRASSLYFSASEAGPHAWWWSSGSGLASEFQDSDANA
jgi:hypothetical protein